MAASLKEVSRQIGGGIIAAAVAVPVAAVSSIQSAWVQVSIIGGAGLLGSLLVWVADLRKKRKLLPVTSSGQRVKVKLGKVGPVQVFLPQWNAETEGDFY